MTGFGGGEMASVVTASAILVAGVVDDFRSRKVHNWLFLACALVAFIVVAVFQGLGGLIMAPIGFTAGLVSMLPLVLLGIVGAGDMKLFAAFGMVAGWNAALSVAVFALIWGAIFGLVQVTLKGQLTATFNNLVSIAVLRDRKALELHKIPFTAAIFMGWLTQLAYHGAVRGAL